MENILKYFINDNGEVNWLKIMFFCVFGYLISIPLLFAFLPKYALIAVFTIPILTVAIVYFINRLDRVILIYIALLPIIQHFNFKNVNVHDFRITIHMMILLLIMIFVFNNFLHTYQVTQKLKMSLLDKLVILLGVVSIGSLIFSYFNNLNHVKTWLLFYTGIVETISFYYIVSYYLKNDRKFLFYIILAILTSTFFSLIVAYFEIKSIGFSLINLLLSRMSIGFGYHNMNLFGINAALILPLAFYGILSNELKKFRVLLFSALIAILLLSVLTLNRGTFLIMGLELFLIFFIKNARKYIWAILAVGLMALVYFRDLVFLYLYRFVGTSGGSGLSKLIDQSAQYRLDAWKTAIKLIWIYPMGIGAGGFQFGWEKYGTNPLFYLGTPHQLFLDIGVDYGVITVIVFIVLMLSAIIYSFRLIKLEIDSISLLHKFITVSLIGYVCYGMITVGELSHLSGFQYPNNGYTLVMLTLVAITSYNYKKHSII